jgi:hypothetical protein
MVEGVLSTLLESRGPVAHCPWHLLYFLPLPQGHFSFRPILPCCRFMNRFSSQLKQVHAGGCKAYQLGLTTSNYSFLSVDISGGQNHYQVRG